MRPFTYSMLSSWLTCKRKYFYEYCMNLVPVTFNIRFFSGTVCHRITLDYLQFKDYSSTSSKIDSWIEEEKEKALCYSSLSPEDEQALIFQSAISHGMLLGFKATQGKFIKDVKIISNDKLIDKKENDRGVFRLIPKPDAIINIAGKTAILEIKTAKTVKEEYLLSYRFQTDYYSYAIGIRNVYHLVLQKPQIYMGKYENEISFMSRLENYYLTSEKINIINYRVHSRNLNQMKNTIDRSISDISSRKKYDIGSYYQSFTACYNFGRCSYEPLCKQGANPLILKLYRKKFKTNEELEI